MANQNAYLSKNVLNQFFIFCITITLTTLCFAEISTYKLYEGPQSKPDNVAFIMNRNSPISILVVDDYFSPNDKCFDPDAIIELLPGEHTLVVSYSHTFSSIKTSSVLPIVIAFNAEAGKLYNIKSSANNGNFTAWVEELINKDKINYVQSLENNEDNQITEPLIAVLKDINSDVRRKAAWELGKTKDLNSVETLITAALHDKDYFVRNSAALALGEIGATAIEPLMAILNDKDTDVRKNAALALGKIGAPAINTLIIAVLKDKSSNVQINALLALVKMGLPGQEALKAALKEENSKVSLRVAQTLMKIFNDERLLVLSAYELKKKD
jgi:hypothetical protein